MCSNYLASLRSRFFTWLSVLLDVYCKPSLHFRLLSGSVNLFQSYMASSYSCLLDSCCLLLTKTGWEGPMPTTGSSQVVAGRAFWWKWTSATERERQRFEKGGSVSLCSIVCCDCCSRLGYNRITRSSAHRKFPKCNRPHAESCHCDVHQKCNLMMRLRGLQHCLALLSKSVQVLEYIKPAKACTFTRNCNVPLCILSPNPLSVFG